ncbi:MAG: hypothetical protein RL307_1269, partial [Pseudomonadota bacterium]
MTSTTQAQNPSAQQASKKLDALRQEALSLSRQEVRKIEVVDTDFVITTRSGQKLIVRDGALRTMMHPNFSLVFTDGPIRGQQILQNAEAFDMDAVARLTGRDAGAVQASDEAKPQAPKPQGEEAGKTVQQAKALGQDPNAGQDPINPERAAADGSSTASTAEGQAAKAPAPEPAVETVAATPASVATSSSGFFANINPAWGALGALGAAGGGGGGEGNVTNYITQAATGGSTADPTTETKLVKALLNVVLGEVNSKLNYVIRSTTGETLAQGTTESVDGQFSLTLQTNYTGPVEITITDFSTSDGLGYRDEATGLSKNLDVPVRAIAVLKADALNTINVTPVTELVVDWLYHPLGGNSSLTELTEEKVTQGNAKVAKALGLVDGDGKAIDLTGLVGLSALNDTTAPSGIEALAYAQVLAALSGYDATAGGSFSKTLAEMSANLRSIKSGDTSPAVVTLISRGALLAMDNMVESGNYSALAARDFISKIFTGVEGTVSSVGLASILFDSSVKWIKKGRTNTLLLNFRDAVKAQTILDNLTFDGVAAKTFGITLADLRLSTTATSSPNANTSNKQWVLTLNGDLDAIKDDADKLITVEYKSVVGNVTTASNQVILKVGSVSPIVESSGLLGSTGTRIPTYEVVSEEGLVDVTVTLIDEKGIEQTFKLKASANRPKVYTYTLSLSEALAPGTYSVKVSLTDQFGNVSNNQTGSGFTLVGQPVTFLLPKDDTGWTESLDAQGHEIANAVSLTDNKTKFREFTYVVKTIAGAEVLVTINNQEFKATESKTVPGWFEVTFYDLPDGVYLPKVKVKDLIAYATSHLEYTGTTVVVDTQPPVLKPELSSVQEGNPDQETVLTITLPTADTGTVQGQARAVKFWDGLSGDDLQHFSWADATHSKLIFRGVTDFEAKSTYTITLTAYDEVGNGITQNFTVRVTNLNEAPTVTQAISESLTEDSGGDAQGWVSFDLLKNASDPDLAAAANNEVLSVDVSRATYSVDASTVSAWPSGLAQVEGKTLKFNI